MASAQAGESKGTQGAVQNAFGNETKGYQLIWEGMGATPVFEAEFGEMFRTSSAPLQKLLQVRTFLPLARQKVLNDPAAASKRRTGILNNYKDAAEKIGIPWRMSVADFNRRGIDVWERERKECVDPNVAFPDYWEAGGKGTLHSYDLGNCCWDAAFDAAMGAYELVHAHHFPSLHPKDGFVALHRELDNAAIDALCGSFARVAVDVGCGTGTSTFSFRETLTARGFASCDLTGIDLSSHFIAVARHRHAQGDKQALGGNLKFRHGNALQLASLGFADGQVDVFMASALTHELPQHASGLLVSEAARVLRPGGVFGYFDLNPVQILRDNPVENLVERCAMANEPFFDQFLGFDMEKALKNNGLDVINIRSTNVEKWPNWMDCPCRIIIARKLASSPPARL